MTDVRPLHPVEQPPAEDLRNALMIAEVSRDGSREDAVRALSDVARLLRHALAQLGEPNEAARLAAAAWVYGQEPSRGQIKEQWARDCAAAVISAQVRGVSGEVGRDPNTSGGVGGASQ